VMFFKERVKSCVKAYSKGEINQVNLLISYENLIESQVINGLYSDAKKTLQKIKLYNLNMLDEKDIEITKCYVMLSKEAYDLYHQDNRGLEQFKYGDLAFQDVTIIKARTLYVIGKISQWRCEIFKGLNEPQKCGMWADVPSFTFDFLIREMANLVDDIELTEDILARLIHSELTYVMNYSNPYNDPTAFGAKDKHFQMLFAKLAFKRKLANYYTERAIQKFSMEFDDVIPFVDYYIKFCSSDEAKMVIKKYRSN